MLQMLINIELIHPLKDEDALTSALLRFPYILSWL